MRNKIKFHRTLIALIAYFLLSCTKANAPSTSPFASSPQLFNVVPGWIDEASGIADSYQNPGFLWVEQDSDNPPSIYLLRQDGSRGKSIYIKGAVNRDWEDMTIGSGPDENKKYIYLADIGDNNQIQKNYFIYRFPEPTAHTDTVTSFDKITFNYPDGSHDAEALLLDEPSKDIYIITKRDQASKIYKLSYPQSASAVTTAAFVMDLPYRGVTSAAISRDQQEVLIKTYGSIYYYNRKSGQHLTDVLKQSYQSLPYQVELQGEAICFANDNSGFYTLSEKSFLPAVKLNFYKRK